MLFRIMLYKHKLHIFLEVLVDAEYESEFTEMRRKLGDLCCETVLLLEQKRVEMPRLKLRLGMAFRELKDSLKSCTTPEEVVADVIRPRISLIQFDYLEAIFKSFSLNEERLASYQEDVKKFMETMELKHSYGQVLMDELQSHVSKPESITFAWTGTKKRRNVK